MMPHSKTPTDISDEEFATLASDHMDQRLDAQAAAAFRALLDAHPHRHEEYARLLDLDESLRALARQIEAEPIPQRLLDIVALLPDDDDISH